MGSLVETTLFQKARGKCTPALRRRRASPLPIAFAVLEVGGNSVSSGFVVRFDSMSYDYLSGETRALVLVETRNTWTDVLQTPSFHNLLHGISEFSIEHVNEIELCVDVGVELPEAGVDAIDDIAEVLVDDHRGGAEDDQVEIEDSKGLVEVRLLEDVEEDLLDLTEVDRYGAGLRRIYPPKSQSKPWRGGVGDSIHYSRCKITCSDSRRRVEDMLVDRRTAAHLVRSDEPFIPTR